MPGNGPIPAEVMMVGMAPTGTAQYYGKPFPLESEAGRILQSWLDYLGLARRSVYVTNSVKCPWDPFSPQTTLCRDWLFKELADVRPKAVITLGSEAHQCFRERNYPASGHSAIHNGVLYFALLHPSAGNKILDAGSLVIPELNRLAESLRTLGIATTGSNRPDGTGPTASKDSDGPVFP